MNKVIAAAFIFLVLPLLFFLYLLSPPSFTSSEEIRIVVPLNPIQEEILKDLKEKEAIRSIKVFTLISGIIKFPGNIEPGVYLLKKNMNAIEVTQILMSHPYQKWVVLKPGLRVEQTAEIIKKELEWDEAQEKEYLENAKEGYMFPDTYLLNVDYSGKEEALRLISNFNEKFDTKIQTDLLSQDVRNDTAVKIASLIEREAGGNNDRALIGGIIWNRLNKGMKLDIDATIQYAKGTPADWWPLITKQDMGIDSPYNTYLYKGLPPTPIANPSLASILAAVYPEETDCLYYLHDSGKNIYCAETYEEHKENIEKYL